MVTRLVIVMLLSMSASGQTLLDNSRVSGGVFTGQYSGVRFDLGNRDTLNYWRHNNRVTPSVYPALVDTENNVIVPVTRTIAQAQADLAQSVSNQFPATVRDRKNPRTKEEVGGWGTNIRSGNGLNEVKETLARMAEEIELLREEIERLKAR